MNDISSDMILNVFVLQNNTKISNYGVQLNPVDA